MLPAEPTTTATIVTVAALLVGAAVLLSRVIGRHGVPVILVFLGIGMLSGSEGIGGIDFEDYETTFRLGTIALVLILFDGGLNTPLQVVRSAAAPAGVLATLGVVMTAGIVALAGRWVGLSTMEAVLLGSVVASTDAAAVFSVLRGSGVQLKQRVAATLELESGLNDPMAVILTIAATEALLLGQGIGPGVLVDVVVQLAVGAAVGISVGWLARRALAMPLLSGGLYPLLTLAAAMISFGAATLANGSGFLAVYAAAVVLGNGPLPYRAMVLRSHDFLAWLAQVGMFLALGLLVFPSQLLDEAVPGLLIALVLAFVARPLAVLLCLLPFRYQPREIAYVGWVGLRGAVPIVLATFPMMAGVEQGGRIFNIVFFVVVISTLVQGWSVASVTSLLGLQRTAPPPPPATIEISSAMPLRDHIDTYYIEPGCPTAGRRVADLPFPDQATAVLIIRGNDAIAPRGNTTLEPGDYVSVLCKPEDRDRVEAMFRAV